MIRLKYGLGFFCFLLTSCSQIQQIPQPQANPTMTCRCTPEQACWPSAADWNALKTAVQGRVIAVRSAVEACQSNVESAACATLLRNMTNPFYVEEQPGATQSAGWYKAWTSSLSVYAVVAEQTSDIVAAVNFARKHNLRLVIKGTGHDYLGRSNAPQSLLVWTHKIRDITMQKSFVAQGCPLQSAHTAVTVGAGTRWLEAYSEVTTKNDYYIQGGGCTSVGVAGGFTQGSGFGSWSRKYGTGAANMLEAEVVTADGQVRIANACQNQDLFWALRGGGGGTFGVVSKMTLATHVLPKAFGILTTQVQAKSDQAYQKLLYKFFSFYGAKLNNEHWGERAEIGPDNVLDITMVFQGLTKPQVHTLWRPLQKWIEARPKQYSKTFKVILLPASKMWDLQYWQTHNPDFVKQNPLNAEQYWWAGDGNQVSKYWYAHQSRWLPVTMFQKTGSLALSNTLFAASRHAGLDIYFSKGLAGAAPKAIARTKATSLHPAAFNAAALAISTAGERKIFPGIKGHEPDLGKAKIAAAKVQAAMDIIRKATPGAGAYANEADYFEKNWQETFWGENYARLLAIKNKYDPAGLFYCHHCIGSEPWDGQGMCRSVPQP